MNERPQSDFDPDDDPLEDVPPKPKPRPDPPAGDKRKPSLIKLNWHGEDAADPLVNWLVDEMLYQEGVALIAGQWGTFKTFVAIDLATSVMTKTPFAGRTVNRQGGVLFIAAEGQEQVRIRLKGAALGKVIHVEPDGDAVKIDPEKMPFVWARSSPRLSDPKALDELRAMANEAASGMKERFGLPLALIFIDALMPAAQFKDADKSTEARQIMDMLAVLGRELEVLVIPIDHFVRTFRQERATLRRRRTQPSPFSPCSASGHLRASFQTRAWRSERSRARRRASSSPSSRARSLSGKRTTASRS